MYVNVKYYINLNYLYIIFNKRNNETENDCILSLVFRIRMIKTYVFAQVDGL